MDLFETIEKRRMVRQFHPDQPITDEELNTLLQAGIRAPSAGNGQAWHFVVVRDERTRHRLATEAGHQRFIDQAPVTIVVCADLARAEEKYGARGSSTYVLQETAAAVENMLLTAVALGLGACWVGAFSEESAAEILELPEQLRPVAMLPIGHPAEPAVRVTPRRSLDDVVSTR